MRLIQSTWTMSLTAASSFSGKVEFIPPFLDDRPN